MIKILEKPNTEETKNLLFPKLTQGKLQQKHLISLCNLIHL